MSVFEIDGELIGTFDGAAGDQLSLARGKTDLLLTDSWVDDQTGETVVELTARAHQPVDDQRIRMELPEHAIENLIDVLKARLDFHE